MEALRPTSEADLVDIVAAAVADRRPLAPTGLGSKSGIGRPVDHTPLDLSGMAGVTLYEPEELIVSAKAGTPVEEVTAMLAEFGQELAFEPIGGVGPDGRWHGGSIGGMVMSNFAGPRRLTAGAVRDFVLGIRGVSGRAEAFKAGGRVVKNVTGYDLARGLCGSWGTLAIATEVTFKVLPKAETEATVVIPDLDTREAIDLMGRVMGEAFVVSSAAHLDGELASLPLELPGFSRTVLRLEGFAPSVKARVEHLTRFLQEYRGAEVISEAMSRRLWQWIGRIHAHGHSGPILWRLSVPPSRAADVSEAIGLAIGYEDETVFAYDWAGGLIWLWIDVWEAERFPPNLGASAIRKAIAANGGGHATLMHGPAEARARIDVFEPEPAPLAALSRRLKAQFDPFGVLNPGRMRLDDSAATGAAAVMADATVEA